MIYFLMVKSLEAGFLFLAGQNTLVQFPPPKEAPDFLLAMDPKVSIHQELFQKGGGKLGVNLVSDLPMLGLLIRENEQEHVSNPQRI